MAQYVFTMNKVSKTVPPKRQILKDVSLSFFPGAKISTVHGQMRRVGDRYVIAMFHPAAALHQAALKPDILADFAKLPELLKQARAGLGKSAPIIKGKVDEKPGDDPKQLSMF